MVLNKYALVCIYCMLGGFCPTAFGQDLNFFHYGVDEGLPSSQVHDIVQDRYGKLWFSTDQGLTSYNGYSFKNYTTADGLTDNTLFKFFPASTGEIWCTTFNKSVFCIDGSQPVFKPYKFNEKLLAIPDPFVSNCVHVSKRGDLFMSLVNGTGYIQISASGKIIHSDVEVRNTENQIVLLSEKNEPDFFFICKKKTAKEIAGDWTSTLIYDQNVRTDDYVKACFFEKTGHAVFTNPRGICVLTVKSDTVNIPTAFEPISLGKLNDQLFWVGFRYGGVGIFDLSGKQQNFFLSGKSVTTLFVDHEGGYWFSTLNDGVYHAKNTKVLFYRSAETANDWIHSLAKDTNENLWLGHYNGDVSILSGMKLTKKYRSTRKKPALTKVDYYTNRMYFMSDYLLFNAQSGEPLENLGANLPNYWIHKNDSILFASYRGVIFKYKKEKKYFFTGCRVNDVCFYQGHFYLASNKGLYKIQNEKTEAVKCGKVAITFGIADMDLRNEKLVLATKGSGVLVMQNNTIYRVDERDGLSGNIVSQVYFENDSVIWACTNTGLNRVVFKDNKATYIDVISTQTGLISNEITDVEVIRDRVWVGTRRGLCYFASDVLNKKQTEIDYHLKINAFKVNEKSNADTCLNYNENRIEFNFGAISFSEFAPLVYRYKLAGLENGWNYTQGLSMIYSSLPPGVYTFIVQAKGTNAVWEKGEQKFSFTILPPWWKTWWFRISAAVLIAALIYLFFKFRILSYNRDITRELLRQVLKRLTKKTNYVVFREQGKDIRIAADTICYVKADGNYIEIHTDTKRYVIRYKIGEFLDLVPDPLEYLRISRSAIIRLDKVQGKSKKDVTVCGEKIPVGETYLDQLQKIKF